jgi:glyoxylase-like metal-dependent hydrolase (beta-lactamase superfamily II)
MARGQSRCGSISTVIHVLGSEFVNFYLVEQGGEVTLVDAGCAGYQPMLEPALAAHGLALTDIKAIVLTHADPDHVGFSAQLSKQLGIPVYVHSADLERAKSGKTKKAEGSPLSALKMFGHSYSRKLIRHMLSSGGAKQAPLPDAVAYEDGETLNVPGKLRAVHTPGHTEGHAVLVAEDDGALFVGDALNNVALDTGQPGARLPLSIMNTSNAQARASLSRIAALDAQTIYFGHGKPATASPKAVVDEALARL